MNITILNTSTTTQAAKKPGGKPYQLIEVAFKNNSFNGAVQGKKITSYSKAFQAVADAQPGQTYEVGTEKNGEFTEWVSLTPAGAPEATTQAAAGRAGYSAAKTRDEAPQAPKGNWETAEERAKKQVYISRLSTISSAIAALSVGAKAPLTADAVKDYAKVLERYVFGTEFNTGFDDIPTIPPELRDPQIE